LYPYYFTKIKYFIIFGAGVERINKNFRSSKI